MNFAQWAIIAILLAMLAAYATERFRVELVAMAGLALAFVTGVVPVQNVFSGFANPAVITVVEILLVVAALSQSRVVDSFARRIVARVQGETAVLALLCTMAAIVSVVMNNIGALALFFPVTLSVCARLDIPPARMLMPLSFATLLGGTCSLTGTPANLVVNDWKIAETGAGFGYFELALVGGPVAIAGLCWIILAAPRLFRDLRSTGTSGFDVGPDAFIAEMTVPEGSPLIGLRLPDADGRHDLHVHGVKRHGSHVFARRGDIVVASCDVLLLEADFAQIDRLREQGALLASGRHARDNADGERIEAVVMPDSLLLGSRIEDIGAFAEHALQVVAIASRRHRVEGGFGDLQVGVGDVLILEGDRDALRAALADCSLLPLSRHRPARVNVRAVTGVAIFGVGVMATAIGLLSPEIAFGGVILALAATRCLNLRTALQDLNWPVIILLACMIPLGMAVEDTGAARVIANGIADYMPTTEPIAVAALVLLMAITMTPFIDNVSTAVVLSPIAVSVASRTGVPVEPLLMAVAVGASLDFLTPFGHHNNAVVMGAAGYRFADFPRLGGVLLAICFCIALLALAAML
jgi:di/tricarboxylate transporter